MIAPRRWTWCELCQCARIRCPKCSNISCSGGGCDECYDEFTEAISLVNQGLAPTEEQCKANLEAIKLDEEVCAKRDGLGPVVTPKRQCRKCRGSGIDPKANHRYTTGGHDDRRCPACNGDGVVE